MRCKAILVILATEWRTAWSSATMPMIAPLTPIGLREKLLVLSLAEAGDRERLDALLGPSRVPTHLGGPLDLGSVKDLRERRLEDVFS